VDEDVQRSQFLEAGVKRAGIHVGCRLKCAKGQWIAAAVVVITIEVFKYRWDTT
jgi:hypothetical protein